VACAQWISRTFAELHGNGARHVVYHQVDLDRFDGERRDIDPTLVLHDARTEPKGQALVQRLQAAFPQWKLEPLACTPQEVPDRMRRARAFVHLSRYEGNSIVCNEAMAMDLPCLFTRVGLMQDEGGPGEVEVIDAERAFADPAWLALRLGAFLAGLDEREVHPRRWVLEHAHLDVARASWKRVVEDWRTLVG
jgi:glycosyltransferase involved in cell wall biosynthesis